MATSAANRGKGAEKRVEAWLNRLNCNHARFAWLRLPDARSAGGRAQAMPSDYVVFTPEGTTMLEVKELAHDSRLPAKNFSQHAAMKKYKIAGCRAALLVYHTNTDRWRCIDVDDLEARLTGSWDLRDFPEFGTAGDAFHYRYKEYGDS